MVSPISVPIIGIGIKLPSNPPNAAPTALNNACAAGSPDSKDTIPTTRGPMIGILPKNFEINPFDALNAGAITFAALPNIFAANPPTFAPTFCTTFLPPGPINLLNLTPIDRTSLPGFSIFLANFLNHLNFKRAIAAIKAALNNVFKLPIRVSNFFTPSSPNIFFTNPLSPS